MYLFAVLTENKLSLTTRWPSQYIVTAIAYSIFVLRCTSINILYSVFSICIYIKESISPLLPFVSRGQSKNPECVRPIDSEEVLLPHTVTDTCSHCSLKPPRYSFCTPVATGKSDVCLLSIKRLGCCWVGCWASRAPHSPTGIFCIYPDCHCSVQEPWYSFCRYIPPDVISVPVFSSSQLHDQAQWHQRRKLIVPFSLRFKLDPLKPLATVTWLRSFSFKVDTSIEL